MWEFTEELGGLAYLVAEGGPIPEDVSLEDVRKVAKGVKASTTTVEGMHPRWPAYLSDQGLGCMIKLWRWVYLIGDQPESQRHLLVRLLKKEQAAGVRLFFSGRSIGCGPSATAAVSKSGPESWPLPGAG